jgi:hypothetical protein
MRNVGGARVSRGRLHARPFCSAAALGQQCPLCLTTFLAMR